MNTNALLFIGSYAQACAQFLWVQQHQHVEIVVIVPSAWQSSDPINLMAELPTAAQSVLIILQEQAMATIVDHSADHSSEKIITVVLQQNARATYVVLQDLPETSRAQCSYYFKQYRDSTLTTIFALLGSAECTATVDYALQEPGAQAHGYAWYFLQKQQINHLTSKQHHTAPHTKSFFEVKGALSDNASAHYYGTITIDQQATQTTSQLHSKHLLVSDTARVTTKPVLEVKSHDVHCNHGSAIGNYDPLQLFYMQSRGIAAHHAQKLILQGFFSEYFKKISIELQTVMQKLLVRTFDSSI